MYVNERDPVKFVRVNQLICNELFTVRDPVRNACVNLMYCINSSNTFKEINTVYLSIIIHSDPADHLNTVIVIVHNGISTCRPKGWLKPWHDSPKTSYRRIKTSFTQHNKTKGWPRPWHDCPKTSYRRTKDENRDLLHKQKNLIGYDRYGCIATQCTSREVRQLPDSCRSSYRHQRVSNYQRLSYAYMLEHIGRQKHSSYPVRLEPATYGNKGTRPTPLPLCYHNISTQNPNGRLNQWPRAQTTKDNPFSFHIFWLKNKMCRRITDSQGYPNIYNESSISLVIMYVDKYDQQSMKWQHISMKVDMTDSVNQYMRCQSFWHKNKVCLQTNDRSQH